MLRYWQLCSAAREPRTFPHAVWFAGWTHTHTHTHTHSLSLTPVSRTPSEFLLILLFWRNIFGKKDSQVSG